MASNQGGKGNPASHRMSNSNLKARRERSWREGQKRKEERRAATKQREAVNKKLRADGLPTAWEEAKAARFAKRHAV